MANKGNAGVSKLAAVLDARMKEHNPKELLLDFGEILDGYQLRTNTFPVSIDPGNYMVCRSLTLGDTGGYLAKVTTPEGNGQAYIPEKLRKLKPGDHVLVAWVQQTAVVIDLMEKANKL